MRLEKFSISRNIFDINLKFYFILKYIVKSKLTHKQITGVLDIFLQSSDVSKQITEANKYISDDEKVKSFDKKKHLYSIMERIENKDDVRLLSFSLNLFVIKDLLLQEAKMKSVIDQKKLSTLDPLSVAYDDISVLSPYTTRVNGALLALMIFSKLEEGKTNFMSEDAIEFLKTMSEETLYLKTKGLEPNQIFMLMFTESVNQSIISDSGSNYEDRIKSKLIKIGVPEDSITKIHDENDASMEYDFFFKLENKKFGIGAKRTLRERYKQFIKTNQSSHIDVMIEITIGLDLNEDKAKTILGHNTVIFVADEIYESRDFLKKMKGVYSVKSLTLKTLKSLWI